MAGSFTPIVNTRLVTGYPIPVDTLKSVGANSYYSSIATLTAANASGGASLNLWNGVRVIDTTTGIYHKLINYGTAGSPLWSDIEEQESLVVVKGISTSAITTTGTLSNSVFNSNVLVAGKRYLLNTCSDATQNGIYMCTATQLSGTQGTFVRDVEYYSATALIQVRLNQRTLVFCEQGGSAGVLSGHIFRYTPGNISTASGTWELDDFVNGGAFTRTSTTKISLAASYIMEILGTLTVSGVSTIGGKLSANGGLDVVGNVAITGNETVSGNLSVSGFAKTGYKFQEISSASPTVNFAEGNVIFYEASTPFTLGLTHNSAGLEIYKGGTFLITITAMVDGVAMTISNPLFKGVDSVNPIPIARGTSISYTGVILGNGTTNALYGIIAPAYQNLVV